jgi:hypothetical protein
MAHYAFLNDENIVVDVIAGRNENEVVDGVSDWEEWYGDFRGMKCIRTSYNGNIRKQYANIGFSYDPVRDEFVRPKPFPSWTLNDTNDWKSPVPFPDNDGLWSWNEENQEWTR